jgi:tRNA (guanine-N7-)-methyltransferase
MRLRHKAWSAELLAEHKDIALNDNDLSSLPAFNVLEVGSGCGGFLIKMAEQNPQNAYLGAEVANIAFAIAVKKLVNEEKPPKNLKFINTSIDRMAPYVKPASLDAIFLNFSDPWPKKRHHKRRLTFPSRLDLYYSWLKEGGKLYFKTDNDALYEDSKGYFVSEGKFSCTFIDVYKELSEGDVMSEYEEKFRTKGQPIHRIVAVKAIKA